MTDRLDSRTRIKICGITTPVMARIAIDAGADFLGLVFAEGSPRQITDFTAVDDILAVIPPDVEPVGVFAHAIDEDFSAFDQWLERGRWIQLHGDCDEDSLARYSSSHSIIRAFHFDANDLLRWDACEHVASLLIDGPRAGSGRAFDHSHLAAMMPDVGHRVFLAGGLDPDNVGGAIRDVRPYAVDVSSGVELSRGVKDPALIGAFCEAVSATS